MRLASQLKGLGYLVSTVSVALLAVVAWETASRHPTIFACLIGGIATSVLGMFLRWLSHRRDQKDKDALAACLPCPTPAGHPARQR